MRSAASGFVLLSLLLPACSGGAEARVERGEIARLVLQRSDLSRGWFEFGFRPQATADAPPGTRSDPSRFGRQGGWIARYRRRVAPTARGPHLIESRVDLFGEPDGARQDLEALADELERGAVAEQRVDSPRLGDEAIASTTVQRSLFGDVRYYTVVWRQANVVASVLVNGFGRRISLADAVSVARKQERRIERALED